MSGYADIPSILAVAPNGARKLPVDFPNLPITPADLAREARLCCDAGASVIHLHVRDDNGGHSLDTGRYREAIAEIRNTVGDDMLIQVTSEAVGIYSAEQQMAMVRELVPEAVSLAIREIAPEGGDERALADFFAFTRDADIRPQFILYAPEDISRFADLVARGIIPGTGFPLLYVLGRYTVGQKSSPVDLLGFVASSVVREQPALVSNWMMCAFGQFENACAMAAVALGGHARIGFENNMQMVNGEMAPNNAALIDQARKGVAMLGRKVADADMARKLLRPVW
ncbi:3-keto-5-aminohexanoate cleavage protein [Thalassospira sp. MCCC 1A01428]|uniref:3-keto-5-aminohexanoate cleavage protein n=1 Tax=Thalassospira sp. MCCC 1A01428 TaxID=1470575 RepID=UPI000A1E5AA5|nr:3-keto-5-aminohexanoate cleavage protein [Thalassospira sp. MCCC 1A01428]OSQ42951.1 class III aminotransferase [Thalassospira sp. MCCC 1A01428]